MFAKGLYLTILLGPGALRPAPGELMLALESVSVQTATTGRSGFSLGFATSAPANLRSLLLRAGFGLDSTLRVVLVLTLRGRPQVLIDGVVTQHQLAHQPAGKATLTLTGEDLTNLMDRIDGSGRPFPGLDRVAQINLLLASYAALGVTPTVIPPLHAGLADPTESYDSQQGTDLGHINATAGQVGHVFFLRPGPAPGQSVAYWGPEVRVGEPRPTLSIDLGHRSNIDTITFTNAVAQPTLPLIKIQIDKQQITIPLPPTSPLRPQLGATPQPPARTTRLGQSAGEKLTVALLRGLDVAARAAETITAEASVDISRYGDLVYPRDLISVRGAASPYNGLYCVNRVSTEVKRGKCTQRLSFSRAGLFSQTPIVRV